MLSCPECGSDQSVKNGCKYKGKDKRPRRKCCRCGREFFGDNNETIEPGIACDRSTEVRVHGNESAVEATVFGEPPSLDELLAECKVDRSVWEVTNYEIRRWTTPYTDKHKKPGLIPCWHVKVRMVRKVAVHTEFPAVQPVQFVGALPQVPTAAFVRHELPCTLVVPDAHVGFRRDLSTGHLEPFHDRKAMDVVLKAAAYLQPERVVILGDMLDLPEFSDKFIKSPEFYFTFQPALVELAWFLGQLRTVLNTDVPIHYIEGNHEQRLSNSIAQHLIAAYAIAPAFAPKSAPAMSVPSLLGLEELGITYEGPYPSGRVWINDNLVCSHGEIVRNGSGETVKTMLSEARASEIVGHVHRSEQATVTRWAKKGPVSYTITCPGTLARIDGTVPANKSHVNWQQGFSIVYYEDGNGKFHTMNLPITDGEAIVNGRMFQGVDYVDRLFADTQYEPFRKG